MLFAIRKVDEVKYIATMPLVGWLFNETRHKWHDNDTLLVCIESLQGAIER